MTRMNKWVNEWMNEMWLIDTKLWFIRISIKYSRDLINSMAFFLLAVQQLFNLFSQLSIPVQLVLNVLKNEECFIY